MEESSICNSSILVCQDEKARLTEYFWAFEKFPKEKVTLLMKMLVTDPISKNNQIQMTGL